MKSFLDFKNMYRYEYFNFENIEYEVRISNKLQTINYNSKFDNQKNKTFWLSIIDLIDLNKPFELFINDNDNELNLLDILQNLLPKQILSICTYRDGISIKGVLNINESVNKNTALEFVRRHTKSIDLDSLKLLKADKEFLSTTVDQHEYNLFRGMGLFEDYFSSKKMKIINNLHVGDDLPLFLLRKNKKGGAKIKYASYTHSKANANRYCGGRVSIITQATVPIESVIVDVAEIQKTFKELKLSDYFTKEDLEYYKKEREVIIDESNITPKIIYKSGNF